MGSRRGNGGSLNSLSTGKGGKAGSPRLVSWLSHSQPSGSFAAGEDIGSGRLSAICAARHATSRREPTWSARAPIQLPNCVCFVSGKPTNQHSKRRCHVSNHACSESQNDVEHAASDAPSGVASPAAPAAEKARRRPIRSSGVHSGGNSRLDKYVASSSPSGSPPASAHSPSYPSRGRALNSSSMCSMATSTAASLFSAGSDAPTRTVRMPILFATRRLTKSSST